MSVRRTLYTSVLWASAAAAAETSGPLEHVLVTIPLHKSTMETAFPVDALTGAELARETSSTLGDTIASLPGVHNASFGPGVGQPVIRGLSGPRVTSLQNGMRSADASAISADHSVAVEPMLADSIEVLRGPATLLYGGGAIGGVVNVVDGRIPTALPAEATVDVGWRYTGASHGQTGVIRAEGAIDNFAFHFDALSRNSDDVDVADGAGTDGMDYLGNTSTQTQSGSLGASYHFTDGFIGAAMSWLDSDYGLPEGSHEGSHEGGHEGGHEDGDENAEEHGGEHEEEHGDVRLAVDQLRYDVVMHLHQPMNGIELFRGFVTLTDYEHTELEGDEIGTVYSSDSLEGRFELLHAPIGDIHGVMGVQVSDTNFSALGDEAFIPETDTRRLGLFVLEDWHTGDWQWEAGLRWDQDHIDPVGGVAARRRFNTLSASLGTIYEISADWHVSASVSRSERAPSTEELYSNVGNVTPESWIVHAATAAIELGNSGLDIERGVNADLGLRWHSDNAEASVAVYSNDFSNYINLANTGVIVADAPVRRYVQGGAKFVGAEFDAKVTLGALNSRDIGLELGADMVRGELDSGDDIPRLPPLSGSLALTLGGEMDYYFARVTAGSAQDRPGANEEPTNSWWRFDVGGEWRVMMGANAVDLALSLRNATNEEIRLSTSWLREYAPEPGRSLNLSFSLHL